MIATIVFYFFAIMVIGSATMTILSRNPVHSVLFLILSFFNAAGLFLLIGAEFLAFLLVIVYVGAVAVLFLFVVMMLDVDFAELRAGVSRYWGLGAVVAGFLLLTLFGGIVGYSEGGVQMAGGERTQTNLSNIEALGTELYTRYLFIFEAAGLVLLVAMVGAIVLTNRRRNDLRAQNIRSQVARRPEEAVVNTQPGVGQGVEL